MAVWQKRGPNVDWKKLPLWERILLTEEIIIIHETNDTRQKFTDEKTVRRQNRAAVLAHLYREHRNVYLQLLYCLQIDNLRDMYEGDKLWGAFEWKNGPQLIYEEIWNVFSGFSSDAQNGVLHTVQQWMESQQVEYAADIVSELFRIEVKNSTVTIKPRALLKKKDDESFYDEHPDVVDDPRAVDLDMPNQTLLKKFAEVLESSKLVTEGVMDKEDVYSRRRAFLLLVLYENPKKFGDYVLHHYMPDNHDLHSHISQVRQRGHFKPGIIMAFIYAVICTKDAIENLTFWACDPENETPQFSKEFIDEFREAMNH